jgi:hypothetical protein
VLSTSTDCRATRENLRTGDAFIVENRSSTRKNSTKRAGTIVGQVMNKVYVAVRGYLDVAVQR